MFNIVADCKYLVLVTGYGSDGETASPHQVHTFGDAREYLTKWLTSYMPKHEWRSDRSDYMGADWLDIGGNKLNVYCDGELIEQIEQIPYVSHPSELVYRVLSWDDYDDIPMTSDYTSYIEALDDYRWDDREHYKPTLQCVHRNGCTTDITPKNV